MLCEKSLSSVKDRMKTESFSAYSETGTDLAVYPTINFEVFQKHHTACTSS
jgi:hypothetical protein